MEPWRKQRKQRWGHWGTEKSGEREASAGCGGGGQGARKVNQIPTDLRGGRISDGSWSALNIEGQRTRVQMEVCISDI